MSCCGQKREALATHRPPSLPTPAPIPDRFTSFAKPPAPAAAATPTNAPVGLGSLGLRYLARSAVQVRGPSTGKIYQFSATQPVQRVARADSEALLRSGHFRLDG
nr:hypothetical protein [uncultured Albidiferax sp.]